MYGCDSWTIKKAECQRIDDFEMWGWRRLSWESLGQQGDKPVSPKGNQPWIFTGRTGAEAEAPVLGPPDVKSWFIGKDPDAGKDWGQEEKEATEDEIVGCHHQFNGHELEQTPGDSEGQGRLQFMDLQRVRHDLATEQQVWSLIYVADKHTILHAFSSLI